MKIGIILDLIIIVLFILSIWDGYKKGLTKSLLKIFSFVIAIIISLVIFKPVSNFIIYQTQIDDNIQKTIVTAFENQSSKDNNAQNKEEAKQEDVNNIFYNYIENKIIQVGEEAKEYVLETSSREIALVVINTIVFIIVFITTRIILIFVKALADLMTKVPVIKQFNEIGGGIYGALRVVVFIIILFTILAIVLPLIQDSNILAIIEDSILSRFIYENNLIIKIIL